MQSKWSDIVAGSDDLNGHNIPSIVGKALCQQANSATGRVGVSDIVDEEAAAKCELTDVFELGLTLAGAISAGAYSAGVLDFLFQALDEWERHRCDPDTPKHHVVIKVITGASAGAITGALSVVALARGLHPVQLTEDDRNNCHSSYRPQDQPFRCVLPAMWRTWVELPDMLQSGDGPGLLGTGDLTSNGVPARSLLDATVLDRIKKVAIDAPDEPTQSEIQRPVPYIAGQLHVYMTLSNMRGIPYTVEFGRPGNEYGMITHADRAHYIIEGLGCGTVVRPDWLSEDAKEASVKLSVDELPKGPGDALGAWDDYGTAALASGAFPIGLAPRGLRYLSGSYLNRKLPVDLPLGVRIRPNFPQPLDQPTASFSFQTVDGGMFNNNPFDYAQFALFGGPSTPEDRTAGKKAIIMVAPFPEPPKFLPEGAPTPSLVGILQALYPTLINQARFRVSELAPAMDDRDYSRFLIAPLRRIPPTERPRCCELTQANERFPIACGLLGGFGGFLSQNFRAHDFQLGRRNCQRFLSEHLNVRPGGVVQGRSLEGGDVPIIPLFGSASEVVPLPNWPQINGPALSRLEGAIDARLDAVLPVLIDGQTKSRWLRFTMRLGWLFFLRGPTRRYIHGTVLAELVRRRQLQGWEPPEIVVRSSGQEADDVAAVTAELIDPAFQFRTAAGIGKKIDLTEQRVNKILEELSRNRVASHLRSLHTDLGWTLWSRRPRLLRRLRLARTAMRWWNQPTVD